MALLDELKKYFSLKDETLTKEEIIQIASNAAASGKPLKITDPVPTVDGVYLPVTVGVYSNGLEKKEGYDTRFILSGGVWTVIEDKMPKAENKIPTYVPGETAVGGTNPDQRIWKGQIWSVKPEIESTTQEPGVGTDWKKVVDVPVVKMKKTGINLVNIDTMVGNGLVSSTDGGLRPHPDWRTAWKIPVDILQDVLYALGWNSSRSEYAFYKGEIPTAAHPESGAYLSQLVSFGNASKSGGRAEIPIPPDEATWAAITIKDATEPTSVYDQLQLSYTYEEEYHPYSGENVVEKIDNNKLAAAWLVDSEGKYHNADDVLSGVEKDAPIQMQVLADGKAQLTYRLGDTVIRDIVEPFKEVTPDASNVFDWRQTFINGALFRSTSDDAAPYRVMGTTIGANHGYYKSVVTANAHGKQNVDVGSIWTDGTREHVLMNVKDANTLEFISRVNGDPQFSGTTLTHVSGATNTGVITASSTSSVQCYPVIRDRVLTVLADGVVVDNISEGATNTAKNSISFIEDYRIMSRESIVDWLISQVGTTEKIVQFLGNPSLQVRIVYEFNKYAGCTIYSEITNISDASIQLQDIMFVMSNPPVAPYQYYVPTSEPLSFENNSYDFTDLTTMPSMSSRLNFNGSSLKSSGLYGDNLLMVKSGSGIALGFLPVLDTSIEARRTNASNKAIQISNSKKVYMSGIDSASLNTINPGDGFATIAYKNTFIREGLKTAYFIVPTNEAVYVYSYWHQFGIDTVKVPKECIGKPYDIVEKTDNVDILSKSVTSNLLVRVSDTSNHGYLVLRFNI